MKTATMGVIAGLLLGGLVGFLWWGVPLRQMREEVQALKGQQVAAEVAREERKAVESRLKRTEEELRSEKDRRSKLEDILSRGRK
ncbi:MAG TPA: hypothetical protein VGV13_18170 [Methylomirabilota bacterium]|jgi:uncharacterized protein HemX|nr:hypothetical protein [Methylomirabilota bacterium]